MVKRALNFDVKSCDGTGTKAEKMVTKTGQVTERSSNEAEKMPGKFNGKSMERSVHEVTEGFMKSSSLLKHLMTRVHCQTQEITQDNSQEKRRRRSTDVEADWSSSSSNGATEEEKKLAMAYSPEMEVHEEGTDDEVEVICNSKGGKGVPIPSASEKAQFRRSLDSATNMVFHSKTGLPLTSSPAPLRKGKRFDYDSTLNCVAAIKR